MGTTPDAPVQSFGAPSTAATPSDCSWCSKAFRCVTLIVAVLFLANITIRFGINHPPAASGDEVDYDSLGWELAHGRGFRIDTGELEFRRPYDDASNNHQYELGPARIGIITGRPPLFPVLIAGTDFIAGRQFWLVRIVNVLAMAAVCGLLAAQFAGRARWLGILILIVLFAVVDGRTRLYSRAILTEALSALFVAVLALQLNQYRIDPSWRRSAGLGLVFGLAVLARSLFILWLPGLLLMLCWFSLRNSNPSGAPHRLRSASLSVLAFLLAAGLTVLPWAIRNCQLLGRFAPLGLQGDAQLAAAFGDAALENGGRWTNLETSGFYDSVLQPGMTLLEREQAMADYGREQARAWVIANPGRTLLLGLLKNLQEFFPRTAGEGIMLVLAALGGILCRREPLVRIGWGLIAINCLAIALTWSVEGRFLVPLLFVWHLFALLGVLRLIQLATGKQHRSQSLAC